jgi:hypothetical protein
MHKSRNIHVAQTGNYHVAATVEIISLTTAASEDIYENIRKG